MRGAEETTVLCSESYRVQICLWWFHLRLVGTELKLCTLGGRGALLILGKIMQQVLKEPKCHQAETEQRQKLERRGLLSLCV